MRSRPCARSAPVNDRQPISAPDRPPWTGRLLPMKPITEEHLAILRRHMVEVIAIHADLASDELGKATFDPRVMAVMTKVPRHHFVPAQLGGFKWSSQHSLCELFGGTGPEPRPVFSSPGSFAACC